MPIIRKIKPSGLTFTDADWLDPAITPPNNARRFKVLGDLKFAVIGRASDAPDAAIVTLGAMTVDAYVLIELEDGGRGRGKTVAEVEGGPLAAKIVLRSSVIPGRVSRLWLDLAAIDPGAAIIDVQLLEGGRILP